MNIYKINERLAKVEQMLADAKSHLAEFGDEDLLLCSEKQEYSQIKAEIMGYEAEILRLNEAKELAVQKENENQINLFDLWPTQLNP